MGETTGLKPEDTVAAAEQYEQIKKVEQSVREVTKVTSGPLIISNFTGHSATTLAEVPKARGKKRGRA